VTGPEPPPVPDEIAELLRSPFDAVLTDPVRLRLQAALNGLPEGASITFTALRRTLGLSDGNLGAHLAVLVDSGYAATTESWRGRRRTTRYASTPLGRGAFATHVTALRAVIDAAGPPDGT
jgi:DNA-binding transcriptional ArsR family regulator